MFIESTYTFGWREVEIPVRTQQGSEPQQGKLAPGAGARVKKVPPTPTASSLPTNSLIGKGSMVYFQAQPPFHKVRSLSEAISKLLITFVGNDFLQIHSRD